MDVCHESAAQLTKDAVRTLSSESPAGHNRQSVLAWLREVNNADEELEQPDENIIESDFEDDGSICYKTLCNELSDTETTISAHSLENEIFEEPLESCEEVIYEERTLYEHFTAFVNKWEKSS